MGGWPQLRESRTVQAGRAHGTVIRCGLTDRMVAEVPVSVVFYYARAMDDDRLAKGLGEALDIVPVFAGTLTVDADRFEITCDDSGVPMTIYDVDETLADAIGRATLPGSGLVDLVNAGAGDDQLLRIRVSRLSDGGMAIGCSWHHAAGDMRSFMALLRAWSAAVSGMPPPDVLLIKDRDTYLDDVLPAEDCGRPGFRLPSEDEAADIRRAVEAALRTNRTVQIYFGAAEVDRMRAEFSATAGRRLSMNDVLSAHIVTVIRELTDDTETRLLALPVNIRRYLDLPDDVIGNLVGDITLSCRADRPAPSLAAEIRAAVEDFVDSHLNVRANKAFLQSIGPNRLADCVPIGFDPVRRTFSISNWSRFGGYDIAFDDCCPTLVCPAAHLQLPWMAWLIEGFDSTGYLFTVVVPAKLAARLRGVAGQQALHGFRAPDDVLPRLAGMVRKLA